jgi:hypothetical protein
MSPTTSSLLVVAIGPYGDAPSVTKDDDPIGVHVR